MPSSQDNVTRFGARATEDQMGYSLCCTDPNELRIGAFS